MAGFDGDLTVDVAAAAKLIRSELAAMVATDGRLRDARISVTSRRLATPAVVISIGGSEVRSFTQAAVDLVADVKARTRQLWPVDSRAGYTGVLLDGHLH